MFQHAQKKLTSTNMPTTRAAWPTRRANGRVRSGLRLAGAGQVALQVPRDQHPDDEPQARVV